jgi:hypothetical protein
MTIIMINWKLEGTLIKQSWNAKDWPQKFFSKSLPNHKYILNLYLHDISGKGYIFCFGSSLNEI